MVNVTTPLETLPQRDISKILLISLKNFASVRLNVFCKHYFEALVLIKWLKSIWITDGNKFLWRNNDSNVQNTCSITFLSALFHSCLSTAQNFIHACIYHFQNSELMYHNRAADWNLTIKLPPFGPIWNSKMEKLFYKKILSQNHIFTLKNSLLDIEQIKKCQACPKKHTNIWTLRS